MVVFIWKFFRYFASGLSLAKVRFGFTFGGIYVEERARRRVGESDGNRELDDDLFIRVLNRTKDYNQVHVLS